MSGMRGLVPAVVAVVVGVFAGYYTFQPEFQRLEAEKKPKLQENARPYTETNKSDLAPNTKPYTSAWNAPPPLPQPVSAESTDTASSSTPRDSWTSSFWPSGSSAGKAPASSRENTHLVQNEEKSSHEGSRRKGESPE